MVYWSTSTSTSTRVGRGQDVQDKQVVEEGSVLVKQRIGGGFVGKNGVEYKTRAEALASQGLLERRISSGVPSIAPPSQEDVSAYYASQSGLTAQQLQNVDETALKTQLNKPTQTLVQRFMGVGGVSSETLSLAKQGINKPPAQRSKEEWEAIVSAPSIMEKLQATPKAQLQPVVQQGTTLAERLQNQNKMVTGASIEQKPTVFEKPLNTGYGQGKQVFEGLKSIPQQIGEGITETLITQPFQFGQSIGKEAKGDLIKVPAITIGKLTGGAIAMGTLIVTKPQDVLTGTIESTLTKPAKFGTQLTLNLLAFKGAGTILGRIGGKITSLGKKYIPESELVVPEVSSGKSLFPTAKSATQALKKFNTEKYSLATGKKAVYSASDYPFTPITGRTITISSGRGLVKSVDVPGLYTSVSGVSTYFLRLKQGLASYKLLPSSLKEIIPGSPKILAVAGQPIRIPKVFRTSLTKAQSFFGKEETKLTTPKGVPGKPYISPALEFGAKTEAEAVIQVGTVLKRVGLKTGWEKVTGFSKYTKISGEYVPIYEMEAVGQGAISKGLIQSVKVSDYASYSSGVVSKSLINPKNVVSSVVASKKPVVSLSSYSKKAKTSVTVPSVVSSKSVSSVSYKPSSVSSKSGEVSKVSSVKSSGSKSYVPSKVSSVFEYKELVYSKESSKVKLSSYVPSKVSSGKSYKPSYYVPNVVVPKPVYPVNLNAKKYFIESYKKKKLLKGFSVFSRVKGKKVKLASNVPFNLATGIGRRFTGETTARSFVVKPEGITGIQDIGSQNLFQYRQPKFSGRVAREGFKFVEKSRFAINTPGEVQGLKIGKFKSRLSM